LIYDQSYVLFPLSSLTRVFALRELPRTLSA
jgi:hypothetical protein